MASASPAPKPVCTFGRKTEESRPLVNLLPLTFPHVSLLEKVVRNLVAPLTPGPRRKIVAVYLDPANSRPLPEANLGSSPAAPSASRL